MRQSSTENGGEAVKGHEGASSSCLPLKDGWSEVLDKASGKVYYAHSVSREVRPAACLRILFGTI